MRGTKNELLWQVCALKSTVAIRLVVAANVQICVLWQGLIGLVCFWVSQSRTNRGGSVRVLVKKIPLRYREDWLICSVMVSSGWRNSSK